MTAITPDSSTHRASSHHPVVVVGAGPVGMTLALDLARRGTSVLILDASPSTTTNPRCNTTNARSMEYFRRLGLADSIRRAGLPGDHATDVVYCTSVTGPELTRFPFSSSDEILNGTAHEFGDWPTPEPQHRISQIFLEPILDDALRAADNAELRRGHRVEEVRETQSGVTVTVSDGSQRYEVRAQYVVGCDGGSSTVRRAIGARLEGDGEASAKRHSVYFRSPDLGAQLGERPGWMYWWYGPTYRGTLVCLDGKDLYLCHGRVPHGEDPEAIDSDLVLREALGGDFEIEKLSVVRWTARRLVADRFRSGRILLAGDAAHLWLPLGGFGMNTGVADAMSLSWRLHALREGWADERILDDYGLERRSVGEATSHAALKIDVDMNEVARDPHLRDADAAGERRRADVGELIQRIDRQQWFSQGVQFGARYVDSPGVAQHESTDGGAITAIDEYVPCVDPGARMPHHWRPDGSSFFDHLGADFTLVTVGAYPPDSAPMREAATALSIPLVEVMLSEPLDAETYSDRRMVLVRPDHVVAWSGAEPPADPVALFTSLLGRDAADTTRRTA